MARITIVGAGVVGMSVAALLSRQHDVTIVARDLPGDQPTIEWASPWAGASFVAGGCSSPLEQKMQMDAFAELWRLSFTDPESSIKRITIEDFLDNEEMGDAIWWKDLVPEFSFLDAQKLPKGAKVGITYKTLILDPNVFLPWFRKRLEGMGVVFKRMTITALSDVKTIGGDVLVNATGVGSRKLTDVRDDEIRSIRGQTIVVKHNYDKLFMHDNGKDYTYAIPRLDGTVILGGIRHESEAESVDLEISKDIVRRVHENLPNQFSSDLSDYEILGYNVGIRPGRISGIRLEKEDKNGQRIVHAYGFSGGGYISGFGAARVVRDLVEEFLYPYKTAAKL